MYVPLGAVVTPATCTERVTRFMINNMSQVAKPWGGQTSTVKKSVAAITSQYVFKKVAAALRR